MQRIYLDFESSSECDINNTNASVYSNHPSTEILCAVFRRADGYKLEVTDFHKSRPLILQLIENKLIVAHNAIFEQLIWQNILVKRFGYPPLPISKFRCTRAKGQAHSLPGSLEKMAEALNLLQQKDMAGKKLMLKMCKPDGPRDAESMKRLIAYCDQDNITAQAIDEALPDLSPYEQTVWELDQEINLRGVRIDIPLVQEIVGLINDEKARLSERFGHLVQGQVGSPDSHAALLKFVQGRGINVNSMDKKAVKELLSKPDLPKDIREILEIRGIVSQKATAKFPKMLASTDNDGRLRENLVYHGAGTGRWTGQGVQLQNLAKPKKGFDVEYVLSSIDCADVSWSSSYGSINQTASGLVRSAIIPSNGKVLIGGDYAGIEARITPWIAGQTETLDIFRRNEDIYLIEASRTFGRPITKEDTEERQVGKCEVLGLGFQGGIAAFHKMCTIYSVSLAPIAQAIIRSATADELEKAEFVYDGYVREAKKSGNEYFGKEEGICADIIKQRWRANNPKIVEFWNDVNANAIHAVKTGYTVRHLNMSWVVERDFLYCVLPSGRKMAYYKPRVQSLTNKFGTTKETLTYIGVDPISKQLVRERTYGGKLTENIVQAVARDIMVSGMFNVKNYGLDIVLTVHDEILSEGDEQTDLSAVKECFTRAPKWAEGLPLDAEVWKGYRYRK